LNPCKNSLTSPKLVIVSPLETEVIFTISFCCSMIKELTSLNLVVKVTPSVSYTAPKVVIGAKNLSPFLNYLMVRSFQS
jgi:hypothetical protein